MEAVERGVGKGGSGGMPSMGGLAYLLHPSLLHLCSAELMDEDEKPTEDLRFFSIRKILAPKRNT